MRTAWRQPALVLFLVSSVLLVLLVVWWAIFFMQRIDDLKAGQIMQLELEAVHWVLANPAVLDEGATGQEIPAGLRVVNAGDQLHSTALFVETGGHAGNYVVIPSEAKQTEIEHFYDRKRTMIVTEGAVLLLLVLTSLGSIFASQTKAYRLNYEMTNFLQAITHELKSPLTSLRLLMETLNDNPEAIPDKSAALEAGLMQVERLERLITNVLQASALEARRLELNLEGMDLSREIRIFAKEREAQVQARGGRLELRVPGPVVVRYDSRALRLILDNLLDNALKYAPETPQITLAVSADEVDAILSVSDNGIGLAPEDTKRVFDRFWRAGSELTRQSEGTGLGLYLVKTLVTRVGGRVEARSEGSGRGTTILVRLPKGSNADLVPTREIIPDGG